MKRTGFLILVLIIICLVNYAEAGRVEIGERFGYGVLKYEESSSPGGQELESEATLRTFLLGLSGEYVFSGQENLFMGANTEWTWGTENKEIWDINGVEAQKNELRIFGQSYDVRLGYKNSHQGFSYKFYITGGWDGIHFERDNFILQGTTRRNEVTEDFSLWRTGGGLALGYKLGRWSLDGSAAYFFYPEGEGKNSSLRNVEYDTEGERLDAAVGMTRELIENLYVNFSVGYTLLDLEINETENIVDQTDSKMQIGVGVIKLTYSF